MEEKANAQGRQKNDKESMENTQTVKELKEEFGMLTKNFDLDDWRDVRTEYYWLSDQAKSEAQRMEWKLMCIRHYVNKGTVLK